MKKVKRCECGNLAEKSHTLKDKTVVYKGTCRTCRGRSENRVRKLEISRNYYKTNRESELKKSKQWRIENPSKVKEYNAQNRNRRNAYCKQRLKEDDTYKLAKYLRSRLSNAVKNNQKTGSAIKDLGCSIEKLKEYLEIQFEPGMSWDNYGKWHIDHVKPLSHFDLTNEVQVKKACHYSNLQPLWASDNLSKGKKIRSEHKKRRKRCLMKRVDTFHQA